MQGLQSSAIRKEEDCGQPFVSTQPQEKKTAQAESGKITSDHVFSGFPHMAGISI